MSKNKITQSEIASRLGVSSSYVSQVLNGNFNFTLKKLIEIGLMMNKVPSIEFLDPVEFWANQSRSWINSFSAKMEIGQTTIVSASSDRYITMPESGKLIHFTSSPPQDSEYIDYEFVKIAI